MIKKQRASAKAIRKKTYHPPRKKSDELINQINSEIRFLRGNNIRYLIREADIGCCHADYLPITRRINKLKKKLKEKSK